MTNTITKAAVLAVNEEQFPFRHLQSENALYTRCGKAVSKPVKEVTDWRLSCEQCVNIQEQVERNNPNPELLAEAINAAFHLEAHAKGFAALTERDAAIVAKRLRAAIAAMGAR